MDDSTRPVEPVAPLPVADEPVGAPEPVVEPPAPVPDLVPVPKVPEEPVPEVPATELPVSESVVPPVEPPPPAVPDPPVPPETPEVPTVPDPAPIPESQVPPAPIDPPASADAPNPDGLPSAVAALTDEELKIAAAYYLKKNQAAISRKGVEARQAKMNENLNRIEQFVRDKGTVQIPQLAQALDLSPGVISHYLQILGAQGRVKATGYGRSRTYTI